jgi:hypothetical protein
MAQPEVRFRETETASQRASKPVTEPAVIFTETAVTHVVLASHPIGDEPPYVLVMGTDDEVHVEWREADRQGRLMILEGVVVQGSGGHRRTGSLKLNPAYVEHLYTEDATDS